MMIKKFLIHANQRSELGIDRSQDLTASIHCCRSPSFGNDMKVNEHIREQRKAGS